MLSFARTLACAAALVAAAAAGLTTPAGAATSGTIVMSGLDNPRGLTFVRMFGGHGGDRYALYVAEAGRGGGPGPHCVELPRGEPACPGATGAVSRLWRGDQRRIITGLPSYAAPDGSAATGPNDVSFSNPLLGYVTIGLGADPALRNVLGDGFGRLARFWAFGGPWSYASDIAGYEAAANPDGGPIDSNPYGLLQGAGGRFVVDAGANALLRLDWRGISTLATFPSRPQRRETDSVPTSVARGPGGTLYVGELTGVPFAAGAARVYRVEPGRAPVVLASGFTTLIDLDVDRAGNLYVLEHSGGPVFFGGTGTLWKIDPSGARVAVVEGLTRPTSVVIGPDGAAYISNFGTSAGGGQVVRYEIGAPAGQSEDEQEREERGDD